MKRIVGAGLACMVLLAGCGGHRSTVAPSSARQSSSLNQVCPPNISRMGCDTPRPVALPPRISVGVPSGLLFPDVSVWQGAVNWPAVAQWQRARGWAPFAVYKMGEYTLDSQALRNSTQTRANGVATWGYWFTRNTGCAHESGLIIWAARYLQLRRVFLDNEVPEAAGYAACLAPPLRAAGLTVAEYTSPGSNPDSHNPGLDEWVASYGPAHPPCVWTCSVGQFDRQTIGAWQFTDGTFGPVVTIPGIGHDDVSVSYGIEKLGIVPPKPPPTPPAKPAGVANAQVSENVATGRWTIKPLPGHVQFGASKNWASLEVQRRQGQWRVRPLSFNAGPLGP